MGRFETTVQTYAHHREPYPPEFFAAVAGQLRFLGTGPGLLALGFAPYVGSVIGVDPEPAMVAEARQSARSTGISLTLIEGRTEDLPHDLGMFDLETIGRALHWMDREATLAALDRILKPEGCILICGSRTIVGEANPWFATFDRVVRSLRRGTGR